MQQMAYSGYKAPQQLSQTPMLFANSVLPMVAGSPYNHWHIVREDFQRITDDKADADFLRDIENQTNFLANRLRKEGLVPEGYLPDPDDLWVVSSGRKATERTLHAWGHAKYSESVGRLLDEKDGKQGKGFLKRRFAVPLLSSTFEKGPMTTSFLGIFDHQPYIVVDDKDGNYTGIDGEMHNAFKEGHALSTMLRWEYLLCIEKIQAAQYALAFLEPPEPALRWEAITRRRDPIQKPGASTPTDCDPNSADNASNTNQLNSQPSAQGGTLNAEDCKESGYLHDTVGTKDLSMVGAKFGTNVPMSSGDFKKDEQFCEAPWSPETLIGLAQSRHTPGLFECTDTDEDYTGAEKLDQLRLSLGLDPRAFWPLVDQHIMAMMHGEIWWATQRKGSIKRFTLVHVADQWYRVEGGLKKHPYTLLDPVRYVGPLEDKDGPRDHSWIFSNTSGPACQEGPQDCEEQPVIVEGSLETEVPIEIHDVQGDGDPLGETEENDMHQLPPPIQTWPPKLRGMTPDECNGLMDVIEAQCPSMILKYEQLSDGSYCLRGQISDGEWSPPIDNAAMWHRRPPTMDRAMKRAVEYGRAVRCSDQ